MHIVLGALILYLAAKGRLPVYSSFVTERGETDE